MSETQNTSQKVCCRCGIDLAGKKRYKDERGYWCVECSKTDHAVAKGEADMCPECGREVPKGALSLYEGRKLCSRCIKAHKEIRKPGSKKFHKIDEGQFKEHDRRTLYTLLGVGGVLLIFIIINLIRTLGR